MTNEEAKRTIDVCAAAAMASAKICATLKAYDLHMTETAAAELMDDIKEHTDALMRKIDKMARR